MAKVLTELDKRNKEQIHVCLGYPYRTETQRLNSKDEVYRHLLKKFLVRKRENQLKRSGIFSLVNRQFDKNSQDSS